MGLSALRTFITLLAVTQVCEEMSFKIQEIYIWSYRQGVSLYLAFNIEKIQEIPIFEKADNPKSVSSHFNIDQREHVYGMVV